MPIKLKGSCHCGAVHFKCLSNTPVPYQMCQCSICRKVGGFMGSVNIMGLTKTLAIEGENNIKTYTPKNPDARELRTSKRSFCQNCSSMLWNFDSRWDEWDYPFASAIDTPLLKPEKMFVVSRSSCPDHVLVPEGSVVFDKLNGDSIEDLHKKNKLWAD